PTETHKAPASRAPLWRHQPPRLAPGKPQTPITGCVGHLVCEKSGLGTPLRADAIEPEIEALQVQPRRRQVGKTSLSKKVLERDDDSKKSHPALVAAMPVPCRTAI